jgi:hypothetical protein
MALTTAQQVRLRIQDIPAIADLSFTFDGSASAFNLDHSNLTSATAFVQGTNQQWSATGATFNASGFVTFSAVGSGGSGYRTRYVHSVFSDDDIGHFTAVGGSVAGAAREAARALLFDSLKRAKWAAPDGTEYDDTKAIDALKNLLEQLEEEIQQDEVGEGGFVSWPLGQANWR